MNEKVKASLKITTDQSEKEVTYWPYRFISTVATRKLFEHWKFLEEKSAINHKGTAFTLVMNVF